jgi:hypothetical protein
MSTAHDITLLVDDLAGHWTEPVLKILKATGIREASVDMELEVWQTLRRVLRAERRWQRLFRLSTPVPLRAFMNQALRSATLLVAQKYAPESISDEFENRIGRWAGEEKLTAPERGLLSVLLRRPALQSA